jgi:beta-phosphoglucomutase
MKKYKGIIFDLDGVICNTDEFHYIAWKKLADKLNIYFDREINNRLRGVSRIKSLEIILELSKRKYTDSEKAEFAEEKNDNYKKLLQKMSPNSLTEDVKSTLTAIKKQDFKIAIGSSSKNTLYILERVGLSQFFDTVVDGNQIKHSKPNPEVFLKAAQNLNLCPNECLVVEDAFTGIEAAVNGGFDSAGIGDAYTDEKAVYHIKNLSDLMKIL